MLAWALARWLEVEPLERVHLTLETLAIGLAATLPMLLALAWILGTDWPPARRLVTLVAEQLGPLLSRRSTLELALLAVLAGVAEEVLFRGVLQTWLARSLSDGGGLLVASAIFGLAHFASPAYAVLAGVVGLYLGGLFLLQGNLLAPIVAHAAYDFVALTYLARSSRASVPSGLR